MVVVGSQNPVKIACVAEAFREYWADIEVTGVSVPSGVAHQPRTADEAYEGARNRARGALAAGASGTAYGVGLEGGIVEDRHGMWAYAWIVIVDKGGRVGQGQTARYLLPEGVASLIRGGLELGEADDRFFGRTNSKHSEGAIGILTEGRIDRRQLYKQAVTAALIPFVQQRYY